MGTLISDPIEAVRSYRSGEFAKVWKGFLFPNARHPNLTNPRCLKNGLNFAVPPTLENWEALSNRLLERGWKSSDHMLRWVACHSILLEHFSTYIIFFICSNNMDLTTTSDMKTETSTFADPGFCVLRLIQRDDDRSQMHKVLWFWTMDMFDFNKIGAWHCGSWIPQ